MSNPERLIQELAKLASKYDLDDWKFVFDLLRNGAIDADKYLQSITRLRNATPKKMTARARADLMPTSEDPARAKLLLELSHALAAKNSNWKLGDIRDLYLRAGGKDSIPERRDGAVRFVIRYLATLTDEAFATVLNSKEHLRGNLQSDYDRWVQIIYNRAAPAQKD